MSVGSDIEAGLIGGKHNLQPCIGPNRFNLRGFERFVDMTAISGQPSITSSI
jgi:hypothetical protein